ncbi:hypothetical protein CsSME_00001380 [Camellia sinensis var. sinensis]
MPPPPSSTFHSLTFSPQPPSLHKTRENRSGLWVHHHRHHHLQHHHLYYHLLPLLRPPHHNLYRRIKPERVDLVFGFITTIIVFFSFSDLLTTTFVAAQNKREFDSTMKVAVLEITNYDSIFSRSPFMNLPFHKLQSANLIKKEGGLVYVLPNFL